jgi:hypothetical protein
MIRRRGSPGLKEVVDLSSKNPKYFLYQRLAPLRLAAWIKMCVLVGGKT